MLFWWSPFYICLILSLQTHCFPKWQAMTNYFKNCIRVQWSIIEKEIIKNLFIYSLNKICGILFSTALYSRRKYYWCYKDVKLLWCYPIINFSIIAISILDFSLFLLLNFLCFNFAIIALLLSYISLSKAKVVALSWS